MEPRNATEAHEDVSACIERLKARFLRAERTGTVEVLYDLVSEIIAYIHALDDWREFQRRDQLAALIRKFGGTPDPALETVEPRPDPEAPEVDRLLTYIANRQRARRLSGKRGSSAKRKKT